MENEGEEAPGLVEMERGFWSTEGRKIDGLVAVVVKRKKMGLGRRNGREMRVRCIDFAIDLLNFSIGWVFHYSVQFITNGPYTLD